MKKVKYVIYAYGFDENVGGVIVLHQLCHLLNQYGEDAYLWPGSRADKFIGRAFWFIVSTVYELIMKLLGNKFKTNDRFRTPITSKNILRKLDGVIVVYPEIISGNPLRAKNVVRWFLNKPGVLTGEVNYGTNEMYFYYGKQFNDDSVNGGANRQLKTIYIRDDIYRQYNKGERHGSCYIIRKGDGKKISHDVSDSILIDGMSHEEIAKVFNEVKYCISYDPHTMLSKYAAICGCISIVIPDDGVPKESWRPNEEDRYGIAYGFEDLEWAIQTQNMVLENFRSQEQRMLQQVQEFANVTKKYFFKDEIKE